MTRTKTRARGRATLRAPSPWRTGRDGPGHGPGSPAARSARREGREAPTAQGWLADSGHVAIPWPYQRLREDDPLAVERQRRPCVQLVAQRDGITDPVAEGRIIRPGQHPVDRQIIRRRT